MIDEKWTEQDWQSFIAKLVNDKIVSWKEVATVVLGELNPPQVGTSLASNKLLQSYYPKRQAWQNVKKWLYMQPKGCCECGSLLRLEAEHKQAKADGGIDHLDNSQLMCKRCNAKKRPSHKNAGKTHLTTEAGLMWLLLHFKPSTYKEYEKLCREYGFTMASIRFQEAWVLSIWLNQNNVECTRALHPTSPPGF